jgi:His-Xaa-Ser system radical SAM maturase HxsC
MKLSTAGAPIGFGRSVLGIASRSRLPLTERSKRILVGPEIPDDIEGYRGLITTSDFGQKAPEIPVVHRAREIDHIHEGDIIVMEPGSGFIRSLYRPAHKHNFLFVTERCNSNCLMCSQPPQDRDDTEELTERNLELIQLIAPPPEFLTITGGEPTLLGEKLFRLISELGRRLPNTEVHMLTNGRRFAWPDFTRAFAKVGHPRLSLGIPLYSDVANDHDYVVQAKGAFDQTIMGLQQLARWQQRIEIRVVLHAQTVSRLPELAEFIYRNLTFVEHVALMGLENIGYAPRNADLLWIDPFDYQDQLVQAVSIMRQRGMQVSIYNLQLCLLRPQLWKFARQSISDWKNVYLPECDDCQARSDCAGFFKWPAKRQSSHIRPIKFPQAPRC